jgi:hypothetical protein
MLRIFGPTYRYAGERLTRPEIICIEDHHYDEQARSYPVKQLLDNSMCDPQEHLVVISGLAHNDDLSTYPHVCLPWYAANQVDQFKQELIQPDWTHKTATFNFMINKPRLHRKFLLQLIDHFALTDYTHSLPWQRTQIVIDDLPRLTQNVLYSKIIQTHVQVPCAVTDYRFGQEQLMDQGLRNGSFRNCQTYNGLLRERVFEPSCISLITDVVFFERETRISEKTIMAIWGGTVPIWVGGWRIASGMRDLGFDVFDDIVDHSYETLPDPLDRCYHAVKLNLHLLQEPGWIRNFLQKNHARLQHNLDLCHNNVFRTRCLQQIQQFDPKTQQELQTILDRNATFSSTLGDVTARHSPTQTG